MTKTDKLSIHSLNQSPIQSTFLCCQGLAAGWQNIKKEQRGEKKVWLNFFIGKVLYYVLRLKFISHALLNRTKIGSFRHIETGPGRMAARLNGRLPEYPSAAHAAPAATRHQPGWRSAVVLVAKPIENFIMVTKIFLQRNWHKNVVHELFAQR